MPYRCPFGPITAPVIGSYPDITIEFGEKFCIAAPDGPRGGCAACPADACPSPADDPPDAADDPPDAADDPSDPSEDPPAAPPGGSPAPSVAPGGRAGAGRGGGAFLAPLTSCCESRGSLQPT